MAVSETLKLLMISVFVLVVLQVPLTHLNAHDGHTGTPHWQKATGWPDRVISTYGKDPSTSFSVTWRTDATVGRTIAQIAKATADARFDLASETVTADTERIDLSQISNSFGKSARPYNFGLGPVHFHSVTFDKLKPNTKYMYRVQGRRGDWSEWFQTKTAADKGPVEFVYFGDAQQGIRSHWSRVIRAAHEAAPKASFYVHAGDLVQQGDSDYNWAEWFAAGSYLHARIPTLPVVGNHEYVPFVNMETGEKQRMLTPLWRAQFTLPVDKELPESLHEAVYDMQFGERLHLFAMNSSPSDFETQSQWLDKKLSQTKSKWTVVTMHHPYFIPMHSNRIDDNLARVKAFAPVIKKHKVDLVIVGHIHSYIRSSVLSNPQAPPVRINSGKPNDIETVFVVSSSGASVSQIRDEQWVRKNVGDGKPEAEVPGISVDRTAGNTPMFQVIRVNGDDLEFSAYTATGSVYDRFTMKKTSKTKILTNGKEAYGDARLFENTGPYREWHDLR